LSSWELGQNAMVEFYPAPNSESRAVTDLQ